MKSGYPSAASSVKQAHHSNSASVATEKGTQAVEAALLTWLAENKRLDDFRLVARDLDSLLQGIASVACHEVEGQRTLEVEFACGAERSASVQVVYSWRDRAEINASQKQEDAAGDIIADVDLFFFVADLVGSGGCPGSGKNGKDEWKAFVEFHGRKSTYGVIHEDMAWVCYDTVSKLQSMLMPALPRPICMLDLLLALPVAPANGGPVPFRACILEDMLAEECWKEDSENDDEDEHSGSELSKTVSIEANQPCEEATSDLEEEHEHIFVESETSPAKARTNRKQAKRPRK